jgi:hypothetical protein
MPLALTMEAASFLAFFAKKIQRTACLNAQIFIDFRFGNTLQKA